MIATSNPSFIPRSLTSGCSEEPYIENTFVGRIEIAKFKESSASY